MVPTNLGQVPVSGVGFYGMSVVDVICIKLGESDIFGEKKFFEKPAPRAPRAPAKARRNSVQLWKAGHFWEIISAPLLPLVPLLPPSGLFVFHGVGSVE